MFDCLHGWFGISYWRQYTLSLLYYSKYSQVYIITTFTHWGRVMHIWINKLTVIGSDDVLSPDRRQVIIWTNAGKSLIRILGTNFSKIFREIKAFSFKKIHSNMLSAKWRQFGLGTNVLTREYTRQQVWRSLLSPARKILNSSRIVVNCSLWDCILCRWLPSAISPYIHVGLSRVGHRISAKTWWPITLYILNPLFVEGSGI